MEVGHANTRHLYLQDHYVIAIKSTPFCTLAIRLDRADEIVGTDEAEGKIAGAEDERVAHVAYGICHPVTSYDEYIHPM